MRNFTGKSADIVWQEAATELIERPDYKHCGRSGDTREILPCFLRIQDPKERWILSRSPPYNPAFGLVEFIWIITGHNESRVLNFWNPGLPRYSGSGPTYHGAYGFRLRREFGLDQLQRAFSVLSKTPETRQAVLQIWKPEIDMPAWHGEPVSLDIPCNVMSLLKLRDGRLHWTQIMRSNDIMRGLPYNIIQFTMLQEVMAGWLGCDLGEYFHLSDSLHMYEHDLDRFSLDSAEPYVSERLPLDLSFDETEELFSGIYKDLDLVANGDSTESELRKLFSKESSKGTQWIGFIGDIMAIIGSDAARRYGFNKLSYELAKSCSDIGLRTAGLAWINHKENES